MTRVQSGPGSSRSLSVCKTSSGWVVSTGDGGIEHFPSKSEAVASAKRKLAKSGGQMTVHGVRGSLESLTILGSVAARRLNAIEGVKLDQASRQMMRALNAEPLSAAERRAAIVKRFKRAAAG